jgi:hypothetical protein
MLEKVGGAPGVTGLNGGSVAASGWKGGWEGDGGGGVPTEVGWAGSGLELEDEASGDCSAFVSDSV